MCEQPQSAALPTAKWISPMRALRRRVGGRRLRLAPDSLSDHMRRDLGLSTGRDPLPRDPLRD